MSFSDPLARPGEVTHLCPFSDLDSSLTPCCGRVIFELPRTDRLTMLEAFVTCQGRAS